ncbi:MAG: serine hydrolase [Cyanobacteria bacterium J06598_3]
MTDANGTNNNLDSTPGSDRPSLRPTNPYTPTNITPSSTTNGHTNQPADQSINQPANTNPFIQNPTAPPPTPGSPGSVGSQTRLTTSTYGTSSPTVGNITGNSTGQTSLNGNPASIRNPSTTETNPPLSRVGRVRPLPGQRSPGQKASASAEGRPTEKGTEFRSPRRPRRERRRTERSNGSRSARKIPQKAVSRKLKIAGPSEPPSRTAGGKSSTDKSSTNKSTAVKSTAVKSTAAKAVSIKSGSRANGKTAASKRPAPTAASLARRRNARKKFALSKPLIRVIQLVVGGLGIATIAGTILTMRLNAGGSSAARTESVLATETEPPSQFPITLNQELATLKAELEELPNTYPGLKPKTFYIDVDTGNYASAGGQEAIAAASTIKLPILLAFFEEIDAGRMDLNQTMAIAPEQIAEGSGEMQMSPPGTQFTALEVATQMIVGSDNTATNMMIDLMGGAAALNKRFTNYGLEKTQLTSPLPDLKGTNTTSARDLAHTMLLISQGDSLTMRSRDRILNILNRTYNKSLIPSGLEEKGALTYNKTGDIQSVLGDVSLVDVSNGKRYVIATLVERPTNDRRAVEVIHRISERTYQEAEKAIQPAVSPLGDPSGATTGGPNETTLDGAMPSGSEAATSSPEGANGVVIEPNPNAPAEAN